MLALRVALRYLFSKKTHNAVNILSLVSVVGVAIATAAMVIVLSVFNGFSDLAAGKLSIMDPDLLVVPCNGKVISNSDSIAAAAETLPGVSTAQPLVTERALAVSGETQMPVTILGMTEQGASSTGLSTIMLDGAPIVAHINDPESGLYDTPTCVLSVGAAIETGLRSGSDQLVRLYVPRRVGRINTANPMSAFKGDTLMVAGVYRVEQAEYDTDMIMVPLDVARRLLEYNNHEATAIQVFTHDSSLDNDISNRLTAMLGSGYRILDRHAQQQQSFNMIAIEKWVTLLMLAFILIITSFNIISAIYILKVEKQGNIAVFSAMGATDSMIISIFSWQARLITLAGGVIGIVIGAVITLIQQYCHIIKLQAADSSVLVVDSYPVRLEATDIAIVLGIVVIIAVVCSYITSLSSRIKS